MGERREARSGPPWWALFWSYRFYLQDVKVDSANVLWKLHDKESGIYGTRMKITPSGFETLLQSAGEWFNFD